jgi:hypothetical protein
MVAYIREGAKTPVLVVGKAICVWTPPKADLRPTQP